MIHYNNDNNAYCSTVNDQMFKTREHSIISISTFLHTRNLCSYSRSDQEHFSGIAARMVRLNINVRKCTII